MSRPDITATEQALYFDDGPNITTLKEKRVHARFQHTCQSCHKPIEKGERHWYFFIKDHDAIPSRAYAFRMHLFCPGVYE